MRCTHCGADIPEDQMFCPECGAEVQIVPDYNPLDDVLAREVKGSVEGATRQLETDSLRRYRRSSTPQNVNSTRVLSEGELGRIRGEAGREYGRPGERGRQGGKFHLHGVLLSFYPVLRRFAAGKVSHRAGQQVPSKTYRSCKILRTKKPAGKRLLPGGRVPDSAFRESPGPAGDMAQ